MARHKVKHACSTLRSGSSGSNSSSSSNSILSRALSSMTRLCSDRETLRLDQSFAFESIYPRLCIHLSLVTVVVRAPMPFFLFLSPTFPSLLSHRSKDVAPSLHTLHPSNSIFFFIRPLDHRSMRASNTDNCSY